MINSSLSNAFDGIKPHTVILYYTYTLNVVLNIIAHLIGVALIYYFPKCLHLNLLRLFCREAWCLCACLRVRAWVPSKKTKQEALRPNPTSSCSHAFLRAKVELKRGHLGTAFLSVNNRDNGLKTRRTSLGGGNDPTHTDSYGKTNLWNKKDVQDLSKFFLVRYKRVHLQGWSPGR